jgi:hypothetical protein
MSWDFYLLYPGRGMAKLLGELRERHDDAASRLLAVADALVAANFSSSQIVNVLFLLDDRAEIDPYGDAIGDYSDEVDGCSRNYTYNVSPMFYEALKGTPIEKDGVRGLNGKAAEWCVDLLDLAIQRMEYAPDIYKAMNPENGWGSYDGALELLRDLRRWCVDNPAAKMGVC